MTHEFVLINKAPVLPFGDFSLEPGEYVVGRSSECDVPILDPTISRQHARLVVSESSIHVTDLGSRNGTFIQGEKIERGTVAAGNELRFGRVSFLVDDLNRIEPPPHFSEVETVDHCGGLLPATLHEIRTRLTPGQLRVLACLVDGKTEKETAHALGISPHTVHNHVRDIYLHMEVRSRGELMAKFIQASSVPLADLSPAYPQPSSNAEGKRGESEEPA
jgi:DNA-binding CsgD family transcriptional regulator